MFSIYYSREKVRDPVIKIIWNVKREKRYQKAQLLDQKFAAVVRGSPKLLFSTKM